METTEIAIVGAGLGGLVAALQLARRGYDVQVYEQSAGFTRIGAGIQLGPNVLKIMRSVGLEDTVARHGSKPDAWVSRDGRDGRILADIPVNPPRRDYGASYVTIHRGDFHLILAKAFPSERLHFGHRLTSIDQQDGHTQLRFENGTSVSARIVIGADGVNSAVREALLGPERPLYTGYVGHRAIFAASRLVPSTIPFDACVKWWSEDRHLVAYYLDHAQEEMYFVSGAPQASWPDGAAFMDSSQDEMRTSFADYHPAVHALIDAAEHVTKWPLLTRAPLELWSRGRTVLLGDACHPMKPHMAQGAAMAIEDAAMFARCLDEVGGSATYEAAFALYAKNRIARASRVQKISNANTWLRTQENPDWLYGHEVFTTELVPA